MKRALDLMLSISALTVLLPLFALIAISIKLDSKGPVFFRQGRLTLNGRIFQMLKFRTMIENAEKMGTGLFNYKNDFRVTRIGRILRSTSLDELPQLFNIIKGEMALVGPRPPVTYELGPYENLNDEYKLRFTVLPGITGLAQVSGRNELPWDEKIKYDNIYIVQFKKLGILLDIKLLFLTVVKVFTTQDIYEVKEGEKEGLSDEELARKAQEDVITKATRKSP